jgi:hypothetical protein
VKFPLFGFHASKIHAKSLDLDQVASNTKVMSVVMLSTPNKIEATKGPQPAKT